VTFRGSSSFAVAVEYALAVILHILRVSSNNKGTGHIAAFSHRCPRIMGCKQTRRVTFRGSPSAAVAVEYTLAVILHILRVDSDDKGTGRPADSLAVIGCKQTTRVTFRRSSSAAVAVEYTLAVILHILRVDSDDKGAGYAARSVAVAHVSFNASRQGLRCFGGPQVLRWRWNTLSRFILHIFRVGSEGV